MNTFLDILNTFREERTGLWRWLQTNGYKKVTNNEKSNLCCIFQTYRARESHKARGRDQLQLTDTSLSCTPLLQFFKRWMIGDSCSTMQQCIFTFSKNYNRISWKNIKGIENPLYSSALAMCNFSPIFNLKKSTWT